MKTVIFSAATFILIVLLILFSCYYTAKKSDSLKDMVLQIADAIEKDDWAEGGRIFAKVKEDWEKTQKRLAMLFHHDELEDVGISFAYLESYISSREKTNALSELSVLEFEISHIKETNNLRLENLF